MVADLGLSNLSPLMAAFGRIGASVTVTDAPDGIADADAVVLAAVGVFGDGMRALESRGLHRPLRDLAAAGVPILGIGLGMHLLADMGTQGGARRGLGLLPGTVVGVDGGAASGWFDLTTTRDDGPVPPDGACVHLSCDHHLLGPIGDVCAVAHTGGRRVVAAVTHGSVWGVQFMPESSGADGLRVLRRFAALVPLRAPA